MGKSNKKNATHIVAIVIVSVALLSGAFLTFSLLSAESNSIKITSPVKTCRFVDVPYQATEEYQVDLRYEARGETETDNPGFDVVAIGRVFVRNVDSETGLFTVQQTFKTLNGMSPTYSSTHYVMPGETKVFEETYDVDWGEDFSMQYTVEPGQKTLTRTVTKFRQEERC